MSGWVAGAIVVGATINAYTTSQAAGKEAGAAQSAADQQAAAAAANLQFQKTSQQNAIAAVNQGYSSPTLMSNWQTALNTQEGVVQQQETLAQSLNPNLVAAGGNLSKMLAGGNSPLTQNIQDQRANQRAQLVSQLNASGVGANSSAGLQQLQQFDLGTENLISNTNSSYISQMGQLQTSLGGLSGNLTQAAGSANMQYNAIAQENPQLQQALSLASVYGNTGQINNAAQAAATAAGNTGVGGMIQGAGMGAVGQQLGNTIPALTGYLKGAGAFTPSNTLGSNLSLPTTPMPANYAGPDQGGALSAGGGGTAVV